MFYPLQTALLGVMYVLALGRGLQEIGDVINMIEHGMYDPEDPVAMSIYRLLFAGSILACLFWVSTSQVPLWYFTWYMSVFTGIGADNVAVVCHWTGT